MPGGWYHVFNRGAGRMNVFIDDRDYWQFLSLLGLQVDCGHVDVHAWALMGNHYHLLLESLDGHVDVAMRELGRRYTRYFNSRHGRDGPLFRSRFESRRLWSTKYRDAVLRYVEWNPVKDGFAESPEDYPWTSAHCRHAGTMPRWASREWAQERRSRRLSPQLEGVVECQLSTRMSSERLALDSEVVSTEKLQAEMRARLRFDAESCPARSAEAIGSFAAITRARQALPDPLGSDPSTEAGLSRLYAGQTLESLTVGLARTTSVVRRLIRDHRRRVLADDEYLDACSDVMSAALLRDLAWLESASSEPG